MLIGATVFGVSSSYIGYSLSKSLRYWRFKKYGTDGELKMVTGTLRALNHPVRGVGCPVTILSSNLVTGNENHNKKVLKDLWIDKGKRKKETYYTYHKIGNTHFPIQHTRHYTDWKNFYNKRFVVNNDLKISNIHLDMTSFSNVVLDVPEAQAKLSPVASINIFKLLDVTDHPLDGIHKYKFTEKFINNGDKVTVVGKYHNKKISLQFIGNENLVLSSVRKSIYGVDYAMLSVAVTIAIVALIFCYHEYYDEYYDGHGF